MSLPPSDEDVSRLLELASHWTGSSPDALRVAAVRQATGALLGPGRSVSQLLADATVSLPEVVEPLCEAATTGETYFFRHPEQFRFVGGLLPRLVERRGQVRAWSAGCATGEEAYSLASFLLHALSPGTPVAVLGTDLVASRVKAAQSGVYRAWSLRDSGPLLCPLVERSGDQLQVLERVRKATRFAVHNLLSPLGQEHGPFDLIFCRNVLVYFSPDALARAIALLTVALAPGGFIVFSTMDLMRPPPGMERVGPPEMQTFTRQSQPAAPVEPAAPPVAELPPMAATPSAATSAPQGGATTVGRHIAALQHMERGEMRQAAKILDGLRRAAPEYLPALLERALLHGREGEWAAAAALMRELIGRAAHMQPGATIEGPEPLPMEFYVGAAESFLERRGAD